MEAKTERIVENKVGMGRQTNYETTAAIGVKLTLNSIIKMHALAWILLTSFFLFFLRFLLCFVMKLFGVLGS